MIFEELIDCTEIDAEVSEAISVVKANNMDPAIGELIEFLNSGEPVCYNFTNT